jgi:membrane protein insertase Oxa1/YidC/SpoIIIJ
MPIMLVFFLYHMPAGLTLYWTVSNIFSIAQSVVTKRLIAKHKEEHAARMGVGDGNKQGNVAVETSSTTVR